MRGFALALALTAAPAAALADELVLELDGGTVRIDLFEDVAPGHAERIATLAEDGAYDGVAFHRVIEGFMAQTGDVECAVAGASCPPGTGGSDMPDLDAEFSDVSFERGVVGMARSQNPNSANSQFFIMFAPAPHLNGQYTVVGEVLEGMELVDQLERGEGRSGAVRNPDRIVSASIVADEE